MIDEGRVRAARARSRLSALIGQDVPLKKMGGCWVACCPFHKERSPSFNVVDDKGFFHCFGCGAHGDAIDWIMKTRKLSFAEAVAAIDGGAPLAPAEIAQREATQSAERAAREEKFRRRALAIWQHSRPLKGTHGEAYLRARGIVGELPGTLRFHPRVLHTPTDQHFPALIGARTVWPGREVAGIWRIYLDPVAPRKADLGKNAKMGLATALGSAVRLGPVDAGTRILIAGEGIETCLSIRDAVPELPVWAALSVGGFKGLVLPPDLDLLVLCADKDSEGRPASRQLDEFSAQLAEQGPTVLQVFPPGAGEKDFNDTAKRGGDGLLYARNHIREAIRQHTA